MSASPLLLVHLKTGLCEEPLAFEHCQKAALHNRRGCYHEAIQEVHKGLTLSLHDPLTKATLLATKAWAHRSLDQPFEALKEITKGFLIKEIGNEGNALLILELFLNLSQSNKRHANSLLNTALHLDLPPAYKAAIRATFSV